MNLLNTTLEVSNFEVLQMWERGVEMPPEARRHADAYNRIRRSENGKWVIRFHDLSLDPPPLDTLFTAEETCVIALKEFARLQSCEVDVISRGCIAPTDKPHVYTVNPWIPEMVTCTEAEYLTGIKPKLNPYFSREGWGPILPPEEVARPDQYSTSPIFNSPFYHDTDTRLYI
jgi:hypothetical protein